MGGRWPKQAEARHTSQMDRLRMRGEELAVEAPARAKAFRTRRRDGLTTTAAAAMAAGRSLDGAAFQSARAAQPPRHGHV